MLRSIFYSIFRMIFSDDLDHEKLAENALAILSLSLWDEDYEVKVGHSLL